LQIGSIVLIWLIAFSAPLVRAQGKTEDQKDMPNTVTVEECEGVQVTQCELAKNLNFTLKMGEDLTCEGCFIQLQALGIAPGDEWSYADPHKIITVEEIKEMIAEIHRAYTYGMVRLDGPEVATAINRFCRDIKGPAAVPAPSEKEKKETEMAPASPSQQPKNEGPPSSGEAGKKEGEQTPAGTDTSKEGGKGAADW
jgi:hypothetical protein